MILSKTTDVAKLDQASAQKRQGVVNVLNILLADESVLYTKLRNYYWNMKGVNIYTLQADFEEQFNQIAEVSNVVAEHVRRYGANALGTMHEFVGRTHLFEEPGLYPDAPTMIENIIADHETIIHYLHKDILILASESEYDDVVDLLTGLLHQHEKMALLFRMVLQGQTPIRADDSLVYKTILN